MNTEWAEWIFTKVNNASDRALMMSRKHCHAQNVHSIVFSESAYGLDRIFFADEEHKLNEYLMTVGIHNHKYDLNITGLYGDVLHKTYSESKSIDDKGTELFTKYDFTSGVISGKPEIVNLGKARLKTDTATRVLPNTEIYIRRDVLHNIFVDSSLAIWRVQEIKREEVDITNLYSRNSKLEKFDASGLYQPFDNSGQVRDFVSRFLLKIILKG